MISQRAVYEVANLLGIESDEHVAQLAIRFTTGPRTFSDLDYMSPQYRRARLAYLRWLQPYFRLLEIKTGHMTCELNLVNELEILSREFSDE